MDTGRDCLMSPDAFVYFCLIRFDLVDPLQSAIDASNCHLSSHHLSHRSALPLFTFPATVAHALIDMHVDQSGDGLHRDGHGIPSPPIEITRLSSLFFALCSLLSSSWPGV